MGELLKEMGQRMLDRRKQLKLTQEALAKMAHVTPQTVSTAELGTKAMRPETMLKICDALDISTDYLLRGQVMEGDTRLLNQKVSSLTPCQYRHLENIKKPPFNRNLFHFYIRQRTSRKMYARTCRVKASALNLSLFQV